MDFNMLYNDPIDDFLAKTRESAKVQIRNPGDVRSVQSMPDEFRGTGVPHSDALREMEIANALHPVAEGLSPEESDKFSRMQVQSQRLSQPTQSRSTGSAAIGGNPFSLDTRGLSASVSGIGAAIKDGRNQKKLEEMAPELQEYASRQEAAQTSAQGRRDYLSERIPEVVDTASERDFTRETDQADREHDINRLDIQGQQDQDRQESIRQRQVELEQMKQDFKNNPDNPESQRMYISGINRYIQSSNPGLELIPNQINNILRRSDHNPSESDQKEINDLEKEYKQQSARAARQYREMGVVPGQSGNREPTDEEFGRVAIMRLRGVPEDVITSYAEDIGINYYPPELSDGTEVDLSDSGNTAGSESNTGTEEQTETGSTVITNQQLQDYAEQYTGGDADAARRILKGRGASFE